MDELNESPRQVFVNLNVLGLRRNLITVPKRDLNTREVPFDTFRDFRQHFFYGHNCIKFFKLAGDYRTILPAPMYVVLNFSNKVLFTFRHIFW